MPWPLSHHTVRRRVLMYWALKPVVGIYLLGEPWLPGDRFLSKLQHFVLAEERREVDDARTATAW